MLKNVKAKNIDIVLADTAGRLPTQLNLMDEIRKVQRVIHKALPGAPHEVLLVLDANTGQNTVSQVQAFDDALKVTGLVLTKLDGTAKGGTLLGIEAELGIPVKLVGLGEEIDEIGIARGGVGERNARCHGLVRADEDLRAEGR